MTVPDWVQDSVFYQIFPDRFADGNPANNPPNVLRWDAPPTANGFQGGDLKGIIDRMYYLQDLGINAIYLNPIFLSASNHRYNATDYYQIDPKLGTKSDFRTFLDVAHRLNMRVVLDGVFNHCGRGFFAFNDILENQSSSAYQKWFNIKRFPVDAYSPGDATTYEGWWKHKSLPKFNTDNPEVRKYIMGVARYWMEQGIDGWRLDVPSEIDDDNFWAEFRAVVKGVNQEAYLLGEIWDGNTRWVGDTHFDGLMNYPIRTLILDLLNGKINAVVYAEKMQQHFKKYSPKNLRAMYNLLGSHDTERFLTAAGSKVDKAKLGYLLLMTLPGTPAVYYGDEVGVTGGGDPACRKTFPWDENAWNSDLRNWVKALIRIRKNSYALRRGEMNFIQGNYPPGVIVYRFSTQPETCLVLVNVSDKAQPVGVDLGNSTSAENGIVKNLLGFEEYQSDGNRISVIVNPWSGMILVPKE